MPDTQVKDSRAPKYPYQRIFYAGLSKELPHYLFRQGLIFNIINITGLSIGLFRFIYILIFIPAQHTPFLLFINFLPLLLNIMMVVSMHLKAYAFTVYFAFTAFPALLLIISVVTNDRGVLYYLFPYIIYTFFFLNSRVKIFTAFTSISVMFILAMIYENNTHGPAHHHDIALETISMIGVFVLSSVTLFSMKFQIWKYQDKIKAQRYKLQKSNKRIIEQAKKLNEIILIKDKVFSIISHDIRSPLQGLYLIVDADINDELSLETVKQILPELKEELKKAFDLFDNLLNWAKIQIKEAVVSMSIVDIKALSDRITEHLAKTADEKKVTVKSEFSDYSINADKDILEIVLRNIISNAIKFSHPNETVALTGKASKGAYEIIVRDNGTGISPDMLAEINSKSFYTSPGTNNEQGTGLGLIICRDLIEKCNGNFSIKSETGTGTSVSIWLPQ
jgi:two-component system, sensor histidine kinase and response regulator